MASKMTRGAFLGVDWGTTNRRVYRFAADGTVEASERDDKGLLSVTPGTFPAEAAAIRAQFGDLPMLCAGMVGSARGWANVPYVSCPAGTAGAGRGAALGRAGAHRHRAGPFHRGRPERRCDARRGSAVAGRGGRRSGACRWLLCQPGTHCKWARMRGETVSHFSTSMTGEMFALLKAHSLIGSFLSGEVSDGPAFRSGVADGLDSRLLRHLFGVRAAALLGLRAEEDCAAYTSGLLIGSDIASRALAKGRRSMCWPTPIWAGSTPPPSRKRAGAPSRSTAMPASPPEFCRSGRNAHDHHRRFHRSHGPLPAGGHPARRAPR
jgi:2-dehydro-3-deoxygalactonokinase